MKLNPYKPANTSVVLLAAGHGQRMRPLTDSSPKPLLKIGGKSLIEHHLYKLSELGFKHVVINTAYLSEMIPNHLGGGDRYGLTINYSDESGTGALETAGGLVNALPIIQSDPFMVINADIWTDFDFTQLLGPLKQQARLVMVDNPSHNKSGDFYLGHSNLLVSKNERAATNYTFSGIALYKKSVFADLSAGKRPLLPIFNSLIEQQSLCGIHYKGVWSDIGTPERLNEIRAKSKQQKT